MKVSDLDPVPVDTASASSGRVEGVVNHAVDHSGVVLADLHDEATLGQFI
jgi:hypothetical protein